MPFGFVPPKFSVPIKFAEFDESEFPKSYFLISPELQLVVSNFQLELSFVIAKSDGLPFEINVLKVGVELMELPKLAFIILDEE